MDLKGLMLITLGACLVGLSALGSLKNPVERPMKACGHGISVITSDEDGIPVSLVNTVVGNATHLGLYTAVPRPVGLRSSYCA